MHWLDWLILLATLGFIVGYGVWKTRRTNTVNAYLRGDNEDRWWAVTLSVMATQASAITFLSTPGQGFLEGMGFVQFYFGLPLAMVVIAWVFIPIFYRANVYTAYEYIGKRFDARTRLFTAILFLIQRCLSTGFTIYAPSIVLSKVLHWPLNWTCVFIGGLVILYTTTGGAKAVGVTHKQQMAVMFGGLFVAFGSLVYYLSGSVNFGESLQLAGAMGKTQVIDTSWDPTTKYTLWSGLIGGFFLQLSYFGTDQSQVQRYLGGESIRQARMGLLLNGLLKIPMQFFILLIGVLVFVFYLFNPEPLHWNQANLAEAERLETSSIVTELEAAHTTVLEQRRFMVEELVQAQRVKDVDKMRILQQRIQELNTEDAALKLRFQERLKELAPEAEPNDKDYIFITWVMDHLPVGIVGLLLAMIFCAGMGSTSSQLSALATTAVVDIFTRTRIEGAQVVATKWATVAFGILALLFAAVFPLFDNLIQAVNVLGSLFYGTILGIFLLAFFWKRIEGKATFLAGCFTQTIILVHFALDKMNTFARTLPNGTTYDPLELAFLWYNLLGPAVLITTACLIQATVDHRRKPAADRPISRNTQ